MELLPCELQNDIMSHLSPTDLAACACVNKSWQTASTDNAIWFDIYKTMVPNVKQITPTSVHLDAQGKMPSPPTWSRCGKHYLGPNKKDISTWDALGKPCCVLKHYEQDSLRDMACHLPVQSHIDYKRLVVQSLRDRVVTGMWPASLLRRTRHARASLVTCKRRAQVLQHELDSLHKREDEMQRVAKVFDDSIRQLRLRSF